LNITDDHLDRYESFDAYARAKGNPFVNMGLGDYAIIPAGDALVAREAARGRAEIVTFSTTGEADVSLAGDAIVDRRSGEQYAVRPRRMGGAHNAANAGASIAVASAFGTAPAAIRAALASFEGLGHRTAFVAELAGVRYYDDSKGTNVGASVAALRGLAEP